MVLSRPPFAPGRQVQAFIRRASSLALLVLLAAGSIEARATTPPSPAPAGTPAASAREASPAEVRLDFATYNPSSLVLKKQGWLEEDLKAEGISVRWLFSAGSNKANELLSSNSTDFASTA